MILHVLIALVAGWIQRHQQRVRRIGGMEECYQG
jgi:hypothetical protein